ncbi:MAG: hypothetical protein QXX64_05255 [Nitrososphaera sp.]
MVITLCFESKEEAGKRGIIISTSLKIKTRRLRKRALLLPLDERQAVWA